jgi:hypothetical protein
MKVLSPSWLARGFAGHASTKLGILMCLACLLSTAAAEELPVIRSGPGNQVPNCVRPLAMMRFVSDRNRSLDPPGTIDHRFRDLGVAYRRIGACVQKVRGRCEGVRWDFAFFQMLIETNFLTFRKPDGNPGSVSSNDNNFAGIGATVEGRPGEGFRDIETGVLAHLQHVLMYSGEEILHPVAQRTREVESYVIGKMRSLGRPATFADLAKVWTGTDSDTYGIEIQQIAVTFAHLHCRRPWSAASAVATPPIVRPASCRPNDGVRTDTARLRRQ